VKGSQSRGPHRPLVVAGTAKTVAFVMRVSAEERAAIEAAADRAGVPVSRWAREALLSAALATKPT
jgi:hypothetical protein